jgi:hypothetical protein
VASGVNRRQSLWGRQAYSPSAISEKAIAPWKEFFEAGKEIRSNPGLADVRPRSGFARMRRLGVLCRTT